MFWGLNTILTRLVNNYESLVPYLDENIVGLVEQYVSPEERKGVYSLDGFICNKKIYFYWSGN